jgi:formylmethanofuran dehydrogenase subunit E
MKNLQDVIGFHGHLCPGLALGYRVACAALRETEMEQMAEDEELLAIAENDSCAVDAIQVITGCTLGKGNLLLKDYGKQVYTFVRRPSSAAVRIVADFTAPPESDSEKEMWQRYQEGDRGDAVVALVHSRKAKKIEAILAARDEDICHIQHCQVTMPGYARLYPTLHCHICQEKVAEPKLRVKNGQMVCIPCAETLLR